jgi:flagellar basal body-associated protein FliL
VNKIIIAIIIVAVIALGGYLLLKGSSYKAPSANLPAPTVSQKTQPTSPAQTET